MGQPNKYSTLWGGGIVAIIRIYGARAIFWLFYNNPDTKSE